MFVELDSCLCPEKKQSRGIKWEILKSPCRRRQPSVLKHAVVLAWFEIPPFHSRKATLVSVEIVPSVYFRLVFCWSFFYCCLIWLVFVVCYFELFLKLDFVDEAIVFLWIGPRFGRKLPCFCLLWTTSSFVPEEGYLGSVLSSCRRGKLSYLSDLRHLFKSKWFWYSLLQMCPVLTITLKASQIRSHE